ncbi:MAG: CoA pyrophosphatase [Chloroflexi bacterium]|nr:CoA pyrophosphatase [Chloroflexota bacterium]
MQPTPDKQAQSETLAVLGREPLEKRVRRLLTDRKKLIIQDSHLTPAAVLIPIFYDAGVPHLLLTKRTTKVLHHKGQISFPGGARDPGDAGLLSTALRESQEEMGIRSKDVQVLGELDDIITNTRFVVSPYVGTIPYPYHFTVNQEEIEEVLEVPVSTLLERAHVDTSAVAPVRPYPAYTFEYRDHVIWGVTARILRQFLDIVFSPGQSTRGWTEKNGPRLR